MSIEEEFFKTFGIEPKYTDECALADKYWANEELANTYVPFDRYMEEECKAYPECLNPCSYAYEEQHYPEITNRILLELICILNRNGLYGYSDWGGSYPIGETVEELKNSILNDCITHQKTYNLYKQVQSLFKEE